MTFIQIITNYLIDTIWVRKPTKLNIPLRNRGGRGKERRQTEGIEKRIERKIKGKENVFATLVCLLI